MLYCYCVALLLFVSSYVLIVCTVPLPPGVNPIAVDKYIITILISPIYVWVFQVFISLRSLTKILHALLLSPIRATCTVYLILLDLINL